MATSRLLFFVALGGLTVEALNGRKCLVYGLFWRLAYSGAWWFRTGLERK